MTIMESVSQPVDFSAFATRLGRQPRWLEHRTIMAIRAYADHRHELLAECRPEDRPLIVRQLGEALEAQLSYALYLAEHSVIGESA